jgi:hypothetical protein
MVDGLTALVAKDARTRRLQSVPEPSLSRPAAAVQHKPKEEANARRRHGLPNLLGTQQNGRPKEHCAIRRRSRVTLVR